MYDLITNQPQQNLTLCGGATNYLFEKTEKKLNDIKYQKVLGEFAEREQLIIQFYYFEELTLKEISELLSITESRISQIHKKLLIKIKEELGMGNG